MSPAVVCVPCLDGQHQACEMDGPFVDPGEDFICTCRCQQGGHCPACRGAGNVEVDRVITREMALDAGEPSMEGQTIPEHIRCPECDGTGVQPMAKERTS